jgi:predicted alpha/beta-fold hydrolase
MEAMTRWCEYRQGRVLINLHQTEKPVAMLAYRPHPLLRNGHFQTILAGIHEGSLSPRNATIVPVALDDGDHLVVHEEIGPPVAQESKLVILVHGLGGDHSSPYLQRTTQALLHRGCRVWRVDLRGSGQAMQLGWRPAHAGCSADLAAVVQMARQRYPQSPISMVGFSLSGNILLKMLGELGAGRLAISLPEAGIQTAMAVAPPLDLHDCADNMDRWSRRLYTRYYLKLLEQQAAIKRDLWPQWKQLPSHPPVRSIRQFDSRYTAPLSGFRDWQHYYDEASSLPWLPEIKTPTEVILDRHDPIVTWSSFQKAQYDPNWVGFTHTKYGGHLGYFGIDDLGKIFRWMDYYVVQRLMNWDQSGGSPSVS